MNVSQQIAHRFREVTLNGTWVANTNLKAQLESTDRMTAITGSGAQNTISALAQHVHYYVHGIKNVFQGGDLEIRDKYSFDFPPMVTEQQWQAFLTKFWADAEELAQLIERTPDDGWDRSFVDGRYGTYQRNIDGLIEHAYYHLGQIVLIRKMLMSKGPA
jgi:hypothetical protein